MAEGARLESVFTGNRNVGSNPTPSATISSERRSVPILVLKTVLILRHPWSDLCTAERGPRLNPFSRGPLSLQALYFRSEIRFPIAH